MAINLNLTEVAGPGTVEATWFAPHYDDELQNSSELNLKRAEN